MWADGERSVITLFFPGEPEWWGKGMREMKPKDPPRTSNKSDIPGSAPGRDNQAKVIEIKLF